MAVQTQLYAVPEIEKKESKEQNELENEKIFETKSLNLWYGETQALKNIELEIPEKKYHSDYRSFGLWEVNIYQNLKPHG